MKPRPFHPKDYCSKNVISGHEERSSVSMTKPQKIQKHRLATLAKAYLEC
jgi:hypothetical protein